LITPAPANTASSTASLYTNIDAPLAVGGTTAEGINATGQITGFYHTNAGATNGYIFNPSTGIFTTLIDPAAAFTFPSGINDLGQVARVAFSVHQPLTPKT
jgi:hypothetical protein